MINNKYLHQIFTNNMFIILTISKYMHFTHVACFRRMIFFIRQTCVRHKTIHPMKYIACESVRELPQMFTLNKCRGEKTGFATTREQEPHARLLLALPGKPIKTKHSATDKTAGKGLYMQKARMDAGSQGLTSVAGSRIELPTLGL